MNAWQKRITSCSLLPLGSKSAPPLPAPRGSVERVLEDLLEREELQHAQVDGRVEAQATLAGRSRSTSRPGSRGSPAPGRGRRPTRRGTTTRSGSTNRSNTLASRYGESIDAELDRGRRLANGLQELRLVRVPGRDIGHQPPDVLTHRSSRPHRFVRCRTDAILPRRAVRRNLRGIARCCAGHHAASARRSASRNGIGSIDGNRFRASSPCTTIGVVMPSIRGQGGRDRRREPTPVRRQSREERHPDDGMPSALRRHRLDHAAVRGHVGSPDLHDGAVTVERRLQPRHEVAEDTSTAIGCEACRPSGAPPSPGAGSRDRSAS